MSFVHEKPDNLVEVIENSVEKHSDRPLFGTKNRNGEYEWVTYGQVGKRVENLRGGLATLGVGKNDVVGIIANNRIEWAVAAFATYGLEGRFIPMYEKELAQTWQFILKDSNVQVLFVANADIKRKIQEFKGDIPLLRHIFLIEGEGSGTMRDLESRGEAQPVPSIRPGPNHVAVQIYTSGTTGKPKGVLLSHGNFTSNFLSAGKLFVEHFKSKARSISILPWAHSFGQTGELYNFIHVGGSIGFAESVATFTEDVKKVRPTFLIAVPRVFNKIHARIVSKIDAKGGLAKKLFYAGLEAAEKKRKMGGKSGFWDGITYKLADKIVYKKIRALFGGRLGGSLTGSATMNIGIGRFFSDIGIPVYDCWGLTETSPGATMNSPVANRPGSVGKPIEHVKVAIRKSPEGKESDEGEVMVHGPNVMQGYHNNEAATKAALAKDGWLRTGDCGRIDEDGFLYITGRFKEQYKLENGMYVFPAGIEEDIKLNPYVTNAIIYGEGRPFNVCIIVPDFEALSLYAKKRNLPDDPDELFESREVRTMISDSIAKSLEGRYLSFEIPRRFIFQREEFSLENGMLTQTLKLKRSVAYKKFDRQFEAAYADETGSSVSG